MRTATHTPNKAVRRLESISTAAEYLGVADRTIRRWIAAGLLTGYRVGPTLIRVDLNELDGMLHAIPTARGGGPNGTAA